MEELNINVDELVIKCIKESVELTTELIELTIGDMSDNEKQVILLTLTTANKEMIKTIKELKEDIK